MSPRSASAACAVGGRGRMSIGEVLGRLRPDFPDVSISKIRFLEAEGLVEPERTPSGYRKFSCDRPRAAALHPHRAARPLLPAQGHQGAPRRDGARPRAADCGRRAGPGAARRPVRCRTDERRRRRSARLRRATCGCRAPSCWRAPGSTDEQLDELDGVRHAAAAAGHAATSTPTPWSSPRRSRKLAAFGLEPRHMRAFKTAADREVGLIEQVVSPLRAARATSGRRPCRRDGGRARRAVGPAARRAGQDRPARSALSPSADRSQLRGVARPRGRSRLDDVREVDVVGVRVEMPSNQPHRAAARVVGGALPADLDRCGGGDRDRLRPAGRRAAAAADPRPAEGPADRDRARARRGPDHRGPRRRLLRHPGARRRASRSAPGRRTRSRWPCAPGAGSCAARRCWTRPAWPCPDDQEEEVEKFREFLDQINPEDFEAEHGQSGERRRVDSVSVTGRSNSHPQPLVETCDTPAENAGVVDRAPAQPVPSTTKTPRCNFTAVSCSDAATAGATGHAASREQ